MVRTELEPPPIVAQLRAGLLGAAAEVDVDEDSPGRVGVGSLIGTAADEAWLAALSDTESSQMIRVLVVDEAAGLQQRISTAFSAHADLEQVGGVLGAADAMEAIPTLMPDIVVLSMDLPSGIGKLGAAGGAGGSATSGQPGHPGGAVLAEEIATRFPFVSVIMTSRNGEPEQLRRAMMAGARHFLVKPFTDAELVEGIRSVHRLDESRRTAHNGPALASVPPPPRAATPAVRNGQIFTFYSAKGGAGCTTIACNTAVALKRMTGKDVAIFDCGLLFGDVGVVMNLNPRSTIVDLVPQMEAHSGPLDPEFLSQMMVPHASGVKVLLAPSSPEKAELVTAEHIHRVLTALRDQFDYVVIDTWPTFEERILGVLDAADKIVVPATLEMPAIKNSKLLLDVTSALAYPPEKVVLVLNRADSRGGIRVQDVEQILQKQFAVEIVSDGRLTTVSLNEGVPFVMTQPDAAISRDIMRLATQLGGLEPVGEAKPKRGLLRSVFGG
ncbi:MAG: hypothetical protein AVDCRST_MAG77-3982 [uncultured Chloroflexi bacterium]|uniref:Response regulatory domain-containing protein n=1 Tax=uncultured Chloroflexota bacterium TaxID=166587 RepID=A0A6J4JMT0_9CHLR|nr:MAG: hypothetical protein AVDCRST_MAG77-3982 [uncultured Chloroflexota bacterium]